MSDVYAYWRARHKNTHDTAKDKMLPTCGKGVAMWESPQAGLWLITIGGGQIDGVKQPKRQVPMQVWLQDRSGTLIHVWGPDLEVGGLIDGNPATADQIASRWMSAEFLTKKNRDHYSEHGAWPWDAPESAVVDRLGNAKPDAAATSAVAETTASSAIAADGATEVEAAKPGPTHNSGDAEGFAAMRQQILGEVFEAQNYFKRHPIKIKADADKCENWRLQIAGLAKAADAKKRAEKIPLETALNEIEKKWAAIINAANTQAKDMSVAADTWVRGEQERIRQERLVEARAAHEAAEKVRREKFAAEQAERDRIEAERERMAEDDPAAFWTGSAPEMPLAPEPEPELKFEPVIATEKIMLGTSGRRRSAKAPVEEGKAVIADLGAAAAFYARQQHPDLVVLIQKLADKAAKVGFVEIPGISFQRLAG